MRLSNVATVLLVSSVLIGAAPSKQRLSLDVKDADIHNLLRLLADVGGVNIVASDEVQGKLTVKLKNIPWDKALKVVLQQKKLGMEVDGNIITVDTLANITARAETKARLAESREALAPLLTVIFPVSYADPKSLATVVKGILTPRGSVSVDERTSSLIVTDVAYNVDHVRRSLGI